MTKDYTAKSIRLLNDRDHVRLRTQVYLGNMHETTYKIPLFIKEKFDVQYINFIPSVYKAVNEIIENSLDEFTRIGNNQKNKTLIINAEPKDGHYVVKDNGRGIPIEKHPDAPDLYTPHVCLGLLRSGRNFESNKDAGVIGQNGVGSACTNYCSTEFNITVYRQGQKYTQKFTNGAEHYTQPKIVPSAHESGTAIEFKLDPAVFKKVALSEDLVHNRAVEIAMTNPGLTVIYNDKKYKFKNGLEDVCEAIKIHYPNASYYKFEMDTPKAKGTFYILFGVRKSLDEQMFTWVNSTLLFDEGICNRQFFNAFFDKTIDALQPAAKKEKAEVTRNDVRENLLVLADMKISDPEYDAQSKTRLTGPSLREEFVQMFEQSWKQFVRKNEQWLQEVLEKAVDRHHKEKDKEAQDQHKKKIRKKIDGLLDATSKQRHECQILITEGLSAKSQISEARNPNTTAAFPLTGKINNVYGSKPSEVLKMGKLTDLMAAVGLIPGKKALRSELRYGKIVIATDADYDGDDIFTLLVNLFYQFWPELFDPNYDPCVYRLVAPNVCLVKGKERIHFPSRADYEKVKHKYKGYDVRYYKGLGSMNKEDWEMILSGKTDTFIPIVDDGKMKDTLELLFGNSADARKEWLTAKE